MARRTLRVKRALLDTQAFIMAATENWPDLPKRVQTLLVGGDDKFPLYESEGLQLIWK